MARRLVRGVERDAEGTVTALGDPGEDWSPVPVSTAVEHILARTHVYVASALGSESTIRVVRRRGRTHLRTSANATRADNLARLPLLTELAPRLPVRPRRNMAFLGEAERRRFVDAVLELHARRFSVGGVDDPVSKWFKQDQIHQATHVHDEVTFLPWHRELCNRFEAMLQEVDPGLALHYWDWTTDPRRSLGLPGFGPLMDDGGVMGSSSGEVGPPFERFYDPTAVPHRDSRDAAGGGNLLTDDQRAALPPRSLSRQLPASGRGPTETRLDDFDFSDLQVRPRSDDEVRVRRDRDVVDEGFRGRVDTQFERFWRAVTPVHGWAHAYLGGDIGREPGTRSSQHTSFRDPFVFLLHSNLDRLWASWQLRRDGPQLLHEEWVDPREVSPRIDPDRMYGGLREGRVAEPSDPARAADEGRDAARELARTMPPWDGTGQKKIFPWREPGQAEPRTPADPAVVRPPLYDTYVVDDELTAAWATMQLGRQLSEGDVIRVAVDLGVHDRSTVEIALETAPAVTWWKGLRVPEDGGGTVLLETRGRTHLATATVPTERFHTAGPLVFHKEKPSWIFWRVKRICYRLGDLTLVPGGSRVVFRWERD